MPGEAGGCHLFEEWIRIEFFHIVHAGLVPQALEEHHGAGHGRHAGGIAHGLHTGFHVCLMVVAVVVDVASEGFAIVVNTADAAPD